MARLKSTSPNESSWIHTEQHSNIWMRITAELFVNCCAVCVYRALIYKQINER